MRVLVCGGRDFKDREFLEEKLNNFYRQTPISTMIQGGAWGADYLAKQWAFMMGIPMEQFDAEWDKYGKAAGAIRNARMLKEGCPDLVIAFAGGKGTENMIQLAWKHRVNILDFRNYDSKV